jgi:hypothetical protein
MITVDPLLTEICGPAPTARTRTGTSYFNDASWLFNGDWDSKNQFIQSSQVKVFVAQTTCSGASVGPRRRQEGPSSNSDLWVLDQR